MSGQGIVGKINHSATTGSAPQANFQDVLNLGNVSEGDYISWDTHINNGAYGNQIANFTFLLAGVIPKQEYCQDGDYLTGKGLGNLNKLLATMPGASGALL